MSKQHDPRVSSRSEYGIHTLGRYIGTYLEGGLDFTPFPFLASVDTLTTLRFT